jgi:hypothetical protein
MGQGKMTKLRDSDCTFVAGASGDGTFSIHFRKVMSLNESINFESDASKIMSVLMRACPTGTLVELYRIIKDELTR